MKNFPVRRPGEKVNELVYFGRMLDKIRLHAKGELPEEYQPNLGEGFDGSCLDFLQIDYADLVTETKKGGTDEQLLAWCFSKGRRPTENDIQVWNEYMRKRGWRDELSDILVRRKRETGMADRAEIQTMFEFIDADEGRL